jgi:murein DD-endopeptidase MepM/ murein hydrolase activator NlpD
VPAIALGLLILLLGAAPAHAGSWQRPVDGAVLRPFALSADRYARGQHRGVDLGATPGSAVHSACAGLVTFAGRVPAGGLTVSVRCGELVATYQQLGRIALRAGRRVAPGAPLGAAGRSGDPLDRRPHVHFGVREARSGRYLDPLTLLSGSPPAIPLVPARTPPWPRTDPPLGAPRPVVAPARRPAPVRWSPRAPAADLRRAPARVPWAAVARPALVPTRVPRAPAAGPRRAVPRALVPGNVPVSPGSRPGAAPRGWLPRAAWIGSSPSRIAPAGPRHGADPPPGALSDPAPDGESPRYVELEIPWYVWVGLACVALALPIGGFVAVRGERRRVARRAAPTVRET